MITLQRTTNSIRQLQWCAFRQLLVTNIGTNGCQTLSLTVSSPYLKPFLMKRCDSAQKLTKLNTLNIYTNFCNISRVDILLRATLCRTQLYGTSWKRLPTISAVDCGWHRETETVVAALSWVIDDSVTSRLLIGFPLFWSSYFGLFERLSWLAVIHFFPTEPI